MFECSYNNVPFALDVPQVYQWLAQNAPVGTWETFQGPPLYPDNGQVGLGYPRQPASYHNLPGCLYYPTGASRWASFMGFMSSDQVDALLLDAYNTSGVPQSLNFVMRQDSGTITTPMFLLPPRPIVKMPGITGLFWINLVDARYFWQFKDTGNIALDTGTSWDTYIGELASALGISLSTTTDAVYGSPHLFSDLSTTYQNCTLALDNALASTGKTLVRNLNGTFTAMTVSASDTIIAQNKLACTEILGGGDIAVGTYDATQNSWRAMGATLPSNVHVLFDKYILTSGISNPGCYHLPFHRNDGDRYLISVPLSGFTLGGHTYQGFDGAKTLRSTGEAYFASSTLQNFTQINSLASQLAQDYYTNEYHGTDIMFASIQPWQPEGINDILWFYSTARCETRVYRKPYQYGIDELTHHFPSTGFVSGSTIYDLVDHLSTSGCDIQVYRRPVTVHGGCVEIGDQFLDTTIQPCSGTASNLTVEQVNGLPPALNVNLIKFDQTDGFVVTQPSANIARIDLNPTLIVEQVNGLPPAVAVGLIEFDQADGFIVTQPSAGVARIDFTTPSPRFVGNFIEHIYVASGTWTKPANLDFLLVWCVGGGGGGGAAQSSANGSPPAPGPGAAGGGGAGRWSYSRIAAGSLGGSESYVVGDGGIGGAADDDPGNDGEGSSFGTIALVVAPGGNGGSGSMGNINLIHPGGAPGDPAGQLGDIMGGGDWGENGWVGDGSAEMYYSGHGGDCSPYGSGGAGSVSTAADGGDAAGYGAGGGGAASAGGGTDYIGGDGAQGIIIVHEYYLV